MENEPVTCAWCYYGMCERHAMAQEAIELVTAKPVANEEEATDAETEQ
jgi:hypothetical protein